MHFPALWCHVDQGSTGCIEGSNLSTIQRQHFPWLAKLTHWWQLEENDVDENEEEYQNNEDERKLPATWHNNNEEEEEDDKNDDDEKDDAYASI